ncbi:hypothetical protein JS530_10170 [Bifidobacterium sp. LC6]|uniref:Uncharacterized protein n=1 Tax=Bifidobacterium colobi TaxID=2809026 RepID=A0ABS5UZ34_9BIFI|nr:hypothetical protein [Bifidobacterium colobi]MBT1175856.1 hypothetical protein [Bifidobacterium colobi]
MAGNNNSDQFTASPNMSELAGTVVGGNEQDNANGKGGFWQRLRRNGNTEVDQETRDTRRGSMIVLIALVIAVVAGLFIMHLTRFVPEGTVDYRGYVISQTDLETRLADAKKSDRTLQMTKVNANDEIFSRLGKYYLGATDTQINLRFPQFFNDDQALQFLSSTGTLYDSYWETHEVEQGRILTAGTLYDRFKTTAEPETYLFYGTGSGAYINSVPFTITTLGNVYTIPSNAILYPQEQSLHYYTATKDGRLVMHTITDLEKTSKVKIDDQKLSWHALLVNLGVIGNETSTVALTEPETKNEEQPAENKTETPAAQATAQAANTALAPATGTAQGTAQGNGTGNGQGTPSTPNVDTSFVEPSIAVSNLDSTVYSASMSVDLKDPQGHLVKSRAQIQIWANGRMVMRKYVRSSGKLTLNNLEAGTTYTIRPVLNYTDQNGKEQEKTLPDQTVTTKGVDQLNPITFTATNGDLFAKQIQLKGLAVTSDLSDEAIAGMYTVSVEIKGNKDTNPINFNLSAAQIANLKTGKAFDWLSAQRLSSNQDNVTYTIHVADRSGNQLVVIGGTGTTRTSKQAPSVSLRVVANRISDVQLRVQLQNPDLVELKNYRMTILDSGNEIKKVELNGNVSDQTLSFDDLDANKVLTIRIESTYDLNDNQGDRDAVMLETRIVTVPLSTLGYINTVTTINEVKSNTVDMMLHVNMTQTDSRLVQLIKSLTMHIYDEDGNEIITKTLDGSAAEDLRAGKDVHVDLEGLLSQHVYKIALTSVVHHGTTDYTDIRVVNNVTEFKTMRSPALIQIKDKVVAGGTVRFKVRAVDPDGTVVDGYVGLKVSDNAHQVIDARKINTTKNGDDPNAGWIDYEIDNLTGGNTYFFDFYALEYNEGFTNATRQLNYQFPSPPSFQERISSQITGSLKLKQIKANRDGSMATSFRYSVSDPEHHIQDKKYYFDVYDDSGKLYKRYDYRMNADATLITDAEQDVTIDLPRNKQYTVKLVIYDNTTSSSGDTEPVETVLGTLDVDTSNEVNYIATPQELYDVAKNPTGHYVVIADLDLTQAGDTGTVTGAFKGQIDFQGYNVTFRASNARRAVFERNEGTLKNIVLNTGIKDSSDVDNASGFVLSNAGVIENAMVTFAESTAGTYGNDTVAGIILNNESKGVLRNFVINATASLVAKHKAAYGVASNSGKVYDGYVYGSALDASRANDNMFLFNKDNETGTDDPYAITNPDAYKQVGGIIGGNNASGSAQELYSTIDIIWPTWHTGSDLDNGNIRYDESSVGALVGMNWGTASNMVSSITSEPTSSELFAYGPVVGRNGDNKAANSEVYYTANSYFSNTNLAKRVSKLTLNDVDFHNSTLNGVDNGVQFDADNYINIGYYAHLHMPSVMPSQPMLALPDVDDTEAVEVKSITVVEHDDSSATLDILLNNPGSGAVRAIGVGDMGNVKIVSQTQGLRQTVVRVAISNPERFVSKYSITKVTVANNYTGGRDITRTYAAGEKTFDVDFFRYITNNTDWAQYVAKDGTENYKLQANLNMTGVDTSLIYAKQITGILDGNGHTVANAYIDATNNAGYQTIFNNVTGQIRNINFQNISGSNFRGIILTSQIGSGGEQPVLENIHLEKITINGSLTGGTSYNQGTLAAVAKSTVIRNVGANDVTFHPADRNSAATWTFGGLVGTLLGGGSMENSYVSGLKMTIDWTKGPFIYAGIGGLIGNLNSGSWAKNVYAAGVMNINTTGNIGGLIGAGSGVTTNAFTDMKINITGDIFHQSISSAGMFGVNSSSVGSNLLVTGDMTSAAANSVSKRVARSANDADVAAKTNSYAAAEMLVNGYRQDPDTVTDATGVLTYEQLTDPTTYTDTIQLGDQFDVSGVTAGNLPKLYKAGTTELLPGQVDLPLRENTGGTVTVTGITTSGTVTDASARLVLNITHPVGYTVKSVTFGNLKATVVDQQVQPGGVTSNVVVDVTAQKYYDAYTLTSITGTDASGKETTTETDVRLDQPFYKQIGSVADWNNIDPTSDENYRITTDIAFTADQSARMRRNIQANRVVGPTDRHVTLSGITLNLDGNAIDANSANVFDSIDTEFANVDVKDFTIDVVPAGATSSNYSGAVAFIRSAVGSVHDVNITGLRINQNNTNLHKGNGVGFIATSDFARGSLSGSNIVIDDAKVNGGTYVGAIRGGANGFYNITGVRATNIDVMGGSTNLGGLAGSATYFASLYAEHINVHTDANSATLIGGIRGSGDWSEVNGAIIKDVTVNAPNATGYVGGVAAAGPVKYVTAEQITVNAPNAREVGGLVGGNSRASVTYSALRNSTVTGGSDVGGLAGHLGNGGSYVNYISDVTVTGDTAVGGLYGEGYASAEGLTNNTGGVVNVTVSGSADVGGVIGLGYSDVQGTYVRGTTVTASNGNAGGIAGRYRGRLQHTLSDNSIQATVTSSTGNAGGVLGYWDQVAGTNGYNDLNISNNVIAGLGSDAQAITGGANAGGLVGTSSVQRYYREWTGNILLADVTVSSSGSSGSVAAFDIGGADGSQLTVKMRVHNSVHIQHQDATDAVKPNRVDGSGNAVDVASVVDSAYLADSANYTAIGFAAANNTNGTWTWDLSMPAGGNMPNVWMRGNTAGVSLAGAAGIPPSGEDPTAYRVALQDAQSAIAIPGDAAAGASLFSLRRADAAVELPSVEAYTSGVNSVNLEFSGDAVDGLSAAAGASASSTSSSSASASASSGTSASTSSPDSGDSVAQTGSEDANASDSAESDAGSGLSVTLNGDASTTREITARTMTVDWDFAKALKITVSNGVKSKTITVKPESVERHVMTYGKGYYYISDAGVVGASGTLPGAFVHLYDGKALTTDGHILDVSTGNELGTVSGASWAAETKALGSFELGGATVESYGSYSQVGSAAGDAADVAGNAQSESAQSGTAQSDGAAQSDAAQSDSTAQSDAAQSDANNATPSDAANAGGEAAQSDSAESVTADAAGTAQSNSTAQSSSATRRMRLIVKNGRLGAVDGSLDVVPDSLIFDSVSGKQYETVLGTDGVMLNLGDALNLPDSFRNSGIAYMTNNLNSESHYVLFEYADGAKAGYDYVTGDTLFEQGGAAAESTSLFSFARAMFMQRSPFATGKSTSVFQKAKALAGKLQSDPISSVQAGGADADSDSAGAGKSGAKAGSGAGDSAKSDGSSTSGSENASGTGESDDSSSSADSGDSAASTGSDSSSSDSSSSDSSSSEPDAATNSDASKAFSGVNSQYVPFYNAETEQYEVYSSDELLNADKAHATSETAKINASDTLKRYYAMPDLRVAVRNNLPGFLIAGGLALAVLAGLAYLEFRRRRS